MKGYKATNKDMKCRDFQFKLGKEYEEDSAVLCEKGFHFCENPLDVLNYYDLCESRFFEVEADGVSNKTKDDTKRVSKKISLKAELGIDGFVKASFNYIKKQCEINDKVATSGHYSQVATSGNYSKVATSGHYSKVATSGNSSKVATSGHSSQVATSGDYSQVATSGHYSKVATSGHSSQVAIDGKYSVGMCAGINSKIKGKKGNWITLAEWTYDDELNKVIPVCVKSIQIDGKTIKEDTYYKLEDGIFIEC